MEPIHILADQELQNASSLKLQEGHVSLGRPRILKRSIKFGGQASLLHGPHTTGASVRRGKKSNFLADTVVAN